MRIPKIKIIKLKESLKRLLWILVEKAFLTYLVLLFISLIFGAVIYYQYSSIIERAEIEIIREPLHFQEKTYQNILKIWQERESRFQKADSKEFPDLPKTSQEEAVPEETFDSSETNREELDPEEISDLPGNDQEEEDNLKEL